MTKNNQTLEQELKESCDVTWTSFTAGSSEVEAFFAEEIDIGYIGPVPAINGNVKSNGEITIIANAADAGAVLVKRADSSISSVEDLDKKTVAIPQIGNTQHLCLLNLLSEAQLKPVSDGGTVEVVAVDNSNLQTMFDQGSIDAALVPEPWGTILTENENVDLLLDYQDIFQNGNYPVAVIAVRNEFLEKHEDLVRAFLEAHKDATNALNENPDACIDSIITEIKSVTGNSYTKEVVQSAFTKTNLTTDINTEALYAFAQTSYDQGFIGSMPDEQLVNTSFIETLTDEKGN